MRVSSFGKERLIEQKPVFKTACGRDETAGPCFPGVSIKLPLPNRTSKEHTHRVCLYSVLQVCLASISSLIFLFIYPELLFVGIFDFNQRNANRGIEFPFENFFSSFIPLRSIFSMFSTLVSLDLNRCHLFPTIYFQRVKRPWLIESDTAHFSRCNVQPVNSLSHWWLVEKKKRKLLGVNWPSITAYETCLSHPTAWSYFNNSY